MRTDIPFLFQVREVIFLRPVALWLAVMIFLAAVPGCGKLPFIGKKKGGVSTEEVLKQALQDRNPVVRMDAVRLLGETADTPENQAWSARVLAVALRDRDEEIRLEAVRNLGNIDAAYSNRYLKEALNDRSIKVRMLVVQVLKEMNQKRLAKAMEKPAEKAAPADTTQPLLISPGAPPGP